MKIKRIVLFCLVMIFCLSTILPVVAGTNRSADIISMNSNTSSSYLGNTYIYSNSPESLNSTLVGTYGAWTISKSLVQNQMYDADFYHWNYSGKKLRIGVYIYNPDSTTKSVQVYSASSLSGTADTKTRLQNTAKNVVNYWTGVGATTYSIPQGGSFICYADVNSSELANGKVLFKPLAGNMWCRVVFVDYNNLSQAKNLSKVTSYDSSTCTAAFYGDTKTFSYNSESGNQSFYLGTVSPNATVYNTNEYDTPIPNESMANPQNRGNYGVNYNMYFSNVGTKKLRIIPDWDSIYGVYGRIYQSYVVCDASGWRKIDFDYNTQKYQDITVPTNGNVKFVLPDGSTGNVYFSFKPIEP